MASAIVFELAKRQFRDDCCNDCGFDDFNCNCNCDSGWNRWGRWVALGVIIVVAVLFAFLASCLHARYRRRNNQRPYYGTGWLAKPPAYDNSGYNPQTGYYGGGPAAPPYTAGPVPRQETGNTFDSNQGYYGQGGYEMLPPQNAYYQDQRGGANVYQPPDALPSRK